MLPLDTDATWSADIGPNRVLFGPGRLAELGGLAAETGAERTFVVCDPGVRAAGERARQALTSAGLAPLLFTDVAPDPTTLDVERALAAAREHRADHLIAIGGGSALDTAKGVNFLITNGGRLEDYWGRDKATRPMLPSIGIPTTAGTGSEAQSFALIAQPGTHRKMACGDRKARFNAVILDPELTLTMPPAVAAVSGLDALAHALESYVCRARNPLSVLFAGAAFRLLDSSFEAATAAAPGLGARAAMLLGSYLAGAAIEGSMLGAAHAAANPLSMRHGLTHGVAVALMLPHVIRFNGGDDATAALYRELAPGGASALAERVEALRTAGGQPARLRDCGAAADDAAELAQEAAAQWTLGFNPRPMSVDELRELYEAAS